MVTELAVRESGAIEIERPRAGMALSFAEMRIRVQQLDEFYRGVMQKGTDYDVIPGTPKPTLLQPGAQMLDAVFGLAPIFEEIDGTARDYEAGFFAYEIRCKLLSKATGETVAEGLGSCNSKEGRYRWRDSKPTCPDCGQELRVSKNSPEWYCWRQKGGCGATFPLDQIKAGGRVENDDPYTLANTILKMAQKRAHVAATLNATGASRIFTQDVEDMAPVPAPIVESRSEPVRVSDEPPQSRPRAPQQQAPTATGAVFPICEIERRGLMCGDPVTGWPASDQHPERDAFAVAEWQTKKYGMPLCIGHQKAVRDGKIEAVRGHPLSREEAEATYATLADRAIALGHRHAKRLGETDPAALEGAVLQASMRTLAKWLDEHEPVS